MADKQHSTRSYAFNFTTNAKTCFRVYDFKSDMTPEACYLESKNRLKAENEETTQVVINSMAKIE
jgi:hypothetical protein